jgi:hypothetical protein
VVQYRYRTIAYCTVPYRALTVLWAYWYRYRTVHFEYISVLPYWGFPVILAQILAKSTGARKIMQEHRTEYVKYGTVIVYMYNLETFETFSTKWRTGITAILIVTVVQGIKIIRQ